MKKISVVVPCYNEENSVEIMYNSLTNIFHNQLKNYNYEIIFADDFSKDNTRTIIEEICKIDTHVKAVFNAKNFGILRNIFSSLSYATGDAAFLVFGDLQDPPELITEFVESWEHGNKVVIGQKIDSDESKMMTIFRLLYYKIIDLFSDNKQISMFNGYGLYDRFFLDILSEIDEIEPYFKEIVAEYGMDIDIIKYHHKKSNRGKSNFNFLKNYDFAMHGITSSTKMLMRLATFFGIGIGFFCLIFSVFVFINKLMHWNEYPIGLASITIGIFFIGAIILFFIGILGEYILSINERIVKKPRVVISKKFNFENEKSNEKE